MNKTAKIITACASFAAALGLGAYVYSLNSTSSDPTFSNIVEVEPVTQETTLLPENWSELYDYIASPTGLSERAKIFLRQNKDVIGWIKIPNTQIDDPLTLDPGAITAGEGYGDSEYVANSYYLDHNLDGTTSRGGTLFLDYRNKFGSSELTQSDNILIYGHNMANNTMFGPLRKYRQNYSFYDESPFIELSSNYKDYQYIIFGFMITSGNWYTDFRYWDMEEFNNEDEFNSYVETVRKGSMVDTGVDVEYGDKLLTLSTCYADEDNSRFIVVARRLRDGEVDGDVSTIDRTEEYLQKKKEEEASIAAEEASKAAEEAAAQTDTTEDESQTESTKSTKSTETTTN